MTFVSVIGLLSALLTLMFVNDQVDGAVITPKIYDESTEYCVTAGKKCPGESFFPKPWNISLVECIGKCSKNLLCVTFNYDVESKVCDVIKKTCKETELIDEMSMTNYHRKLKGETCKKPVEWCTWERATCRRWDLSYTRKNLISSTNESDMDLCRNKCENDKDCRQYVYNNTNVVNETCKLMKDSDKSNRSTCYFGVEEESTSIIGRKKVDNGTCGDKEALAIEWCRWADRQCGDDDEFSSVYISILYVTDEEICQRNCAYEESCVQYEYSVYEEGPVCILQSDRCNAGLMSTGIWEYGNRTVGYRRHPPNSTCRSIYNEATMEE